MVVGDHVMAEQSENSRQGLTQNGRANVPDMHRLGDVGRAEIDNDATRVGSFLEKQMASGGGLA